jgi:hypothetical protein
LRLGLEPLFQRKPLDSVFTKIQAVLLLLAPLWLQTFSGTHIQNSNERHQLAVVLRGQPRHVGLHEPAESAGLTMTL